MGLARSQGMHIPLQTDEELERAKTLEHSNGQKYEVATNKLHFYAQHPENSQIENWVKTGEGTQPGPDFPPGKVPRKENTWGS